MTSGAACASSRLRNLNTIERNFWTGISVVFAESEPLPQSGGVQ